MKKNGEAVKLELKLKAIVGSILTALLPAVAIAQDCGTYTTCEPNGPCITVPRPCKSGEGSASSRHWTPGEKVAATTTAATLLGVLGGSFSKDKNGQQGPMAMAGGLGGFGVGGLMAVMSQGKQIPGHVAFPLAIVMGAGAGAALGQWQKNLGQKDNTATDMTIGALTGVVFELFARAVSKTLPQTLTSHLHVNMPRGMGVVVTGRQIGLRWRF